MLEEQERYIIGFEDIPGERAKMPGLPAEDRVKNFEEIERGFSPEQAQREAGRCLSCRRCLGCKLCLAACERDAIVFNQSDEIREIEVDAIIISPGSTERVVPPDGRFGYGTFQNVLTDLEFEAILRRQGPYGGLILRPSDGEIPGKVAFIHDDQGGANRDALIVLLKQIAAAEKRLPGSELWLFSSHPPGEREEYRPYLDQAQSLTAKNVPVVAVKGIEDSHNLAVEYTDEGENRTERFQLVVISAQRILSDSIAKLADRLGLNLAKQVNPGGTPSPRETGVKGITLTGGITASQER